MILRDRASCSRTTQRGGGQAGPNRANRGGSWNNDAQNVRAAYRNANTPGNRNHNLGFRLSRAPWPAGWPVDAPISSTATFGWPTPQGPGGPVDPAAASSIVRPVPAFSWSIDRADCA